MKKLILIMMMVISLNTFAIWSSCTSFKGFENERTSISYCYGEGFIETLHLRRLNNSDEYYFDMSFEDKFKYRIGKYDDVEIQFSCTDAIPLILNNVLGVKAHSVQMSMTDEDVSKFRDLFYAAERDDKVHIIVYRNGRAMKEIDVYGSGFKNIFRKSFGSKGN